MPLILKYKSLTLASVLMFLSSCSSEEDFETEAPNEQLSLKLSKQAQSGRYVFEDGSLYEGELVMGLPDGFGTIKFVSGDLYEGQFDKGMANGYGTIRYKSDDELEKYSGNWENGKRSGFGALTLSDQSVLEGHWERDDLSYGEFRAADGSITFGKWQNGLIEEGNLLTSSGEAFSGRFRWIVKIFIRQFF